MLTPLIKHLEFEHRTKRRELKRIRTRQREREDATLPQPTQVWQRHGFIIEAYVVKSGLWQVDTFYRVGSMQMVHGEPKFSYYFPSSGAFHFLDMLADVETWHGVGTPATASRQIPARKWKSACQAMKPISASASLLSIQLGRVTLHPFETRTQSGARHGVFRFRVESEGLHHSLDSEHFLKLLDFVSVRELLRQILKPTNLRGLLNG